MFDSRTSQEYHHLMQLVSLKVETPELQLSSFVEEQILS